MGTAPVLLSGCCCERGAKVRKVPRSVRGQLGTQSALGVVNYVQQALQRGGQHGNHGISGAEGSDAGPRRNDGEGLLMGKTGEMESSLCVGLGGRTFPVSNGLLLEAPQMGTQITAPHLHHKRLSGATT